MDDKVTISYEELTTIFPTEESALIYLESKLWKGTPKCPFCSELSSGFRVQFHADGDALGHESHKSTEGHMSCQGGKLDLSD